ncbi:hypothetical protein FOL47_008799 [Perkinsus chesapeaki]|uniref:Uncharacterized protein n=1 Tax=Perkinsus chesapeaki TaxID=330153 RepID=A0A7J6LCM5_PERCH|nr:hypothetical protein FOL47_008799 [Perkinsus chesapeaki]
MNSSPIILFAFLYSLVCCPVVYAEDQPDGLYKATVESQPISYLIFDPATKAVYIEDSKTSVLYWGKYIIDDKNFINITLSEENLDILKSEFPDKIGGATFNNMKFYPIQDTVVSLGADNEMLEQRPALGFDSKLHCESHCGADYDDDEHHFGQKAPS